MCWQVCALLGHTSGVVSVVFSPDNKRVVSGGSEERVVWQVCTLAGHSDSVTCVPFSPDGKRIVSGSEDKLVKIWDVETGAELSSFVGLR